jgi:hypothetical protein
MTGSQLLLVPLRLLSFAAALALVLGSGWVHGMWSGRWQEQDSLVEAVARVDQVPLTLGDSATAPPTWTARPEETDEGSFAQTGALAYWARTYTHASGNHHVLVILMCGRPKNMAVHTPEVCYQGAGFKMVGVPETWNVSWQEIASEARASFWTAQFRKETGFTGGLRLFWGWNSQGEWQALRNPRWDARGEPFLYKMYVSHDVVGADTRLAQEFMQEFLPTLQKTLFPNLVAE